MIITLRSNGFSQQTFHKKGGKFDIYSIMAKSFTENLSTNNLDFKQSVRVTTTANITLSGTQTIDGISLVAGDRVLVKNQSLQRQNGIYVVASGTWNRSLDANESSEFTGNFIVFVEEGTLYKDTGWILITNNPITIGITSLNFSLLARASDSNGNILFIPESTGDVGISTLTPNARLHVYSSISGDTIFNVEGTNGSLFSITDNLTGSLMSVNNNSGLPVLEVFSTDKIVAGRFGQNDLVVNTDGKVGLGTGSPSEKLEVSGNVKITQGTASTSTSTGALLVTGGIGVGGNVYVGGSTASTTTGTGTLVVTGGVGVSGRVTVDNVDIKSTTASTTTGTGALLVAGGVGVSGNVRAGSFIKTLGSGEASGDLLTAGGSTVPVAGLSVSFAGSAGNATSANSLNPGSAIGNVTAGTGAFTTLSSSGATTMTAAAASTSISTGTLVVTGGIGVSGNINVGSDLTVGGNLIVNGTTTTINSTTITVDDKNIELGSVTTPTNTTADLGGITLKGATDKTIIWDNTNNNWTSSEHWNLPTGKVFKINNTNVLSSNTLGSAITFNSNTASTSTDTGTLVVTGGVGVGGNLNVGSLTESTSTSSGAVVIAGGVGIAKKLYVGDGSDNGRLGNTSTGTLVVAGGVGVGGYIHCGAINSLGKLIIDSSTVNSMYGNSSIEMRQTIGGYGPFAASVGSSPLTVGLLGSNNTLDEQGDAFDDFGFSTNNLNITRRLVVGGGFGGYSSFKSVFRANINSTSTGTGTLVVVGGLGISGNINVGSDLTVGGNLIVNGTTTTINSTTITVDDKNIELGSVTTPTNTTADLGGITLKGAGDKTIIWDNANNNWTSSEHWNLPTGKVFKINNTNVLSSNTLGSAITFNSNTASTSTDTGTLVVTGGVGVGGNVYVGGALSVTSANNSNAGGGQIYLNGANGNRIDFSAVGTASPAFTTRSVGTKIVLYPAVAASSVDYAIGIDGGTFWNSVNLSSSSFKWYAGTTNIATLNGTGDLTANSFVKSGGTASQFLKANGTVDSTTYAATNQTMFIGTTSVNINRASASLSLAGVSIDGNAGTATTATTLNTSGGLTTQQGDGKVGYAYQIVNGETGLFSGSNNSNSVLTLSRHSGNYYSQLGFSSNGNLYYRAFNNVAIDTTTAWQTLWTSSSLTNLNQLTNGPGYTTNVGTVTSVAALTLGTTGTDVTSTVTSGTTTPVITLNVPTASASNRGVLSSADWTTFNNKQATLTNPVTGTGTTGKIPKWSSTTALTDSIMSESSTVVNIAGSLNGQSDDSYLSFDANSTRIGITKKTGFIGKFTYGSTSEFAIAQSNATNILPAGTFTDRFVIASNGNVVISGNTNISGAVNNFSSNTSSTSTNTGTLVIAGGIGVGGRVTVDNVDIKSTTASTTTGTGALLVAGGVGIGGNINVGGPINNLTASTPCTSTGTGTLVVTGGVGIGGNINVGSDLTVGGNLIVNGTTTTINSTTITVDDKNIELGSVTTPTNTTADLGGITLKGATDKTIIWDNANNNWTSSEHWNLPTGKVFKINNTNVLSSNTLGSAITFNSNTASTSTGTGTLVVTGGVGVSGNINIGDSFNGTKASNIPAAINLYLFQNFR